MRSVITALSLVALVSGCQIPTSEDATDRMEDFDETPTQNTEDQIPIGVYTDPGINFIAVLTGEVVIESDDPWYRLETEVFLDFVPPTPDIVISQDDSYRGTQDLFWAYIQKPEEFDLAPAWAQERYGNLFGLLEFTYQGPLEMEEWAPAPGPCRDHWELYELLEECLIQDEDCYIGRQVQEPGMDREYRVLPILGSEGALDLVDEICTG